jgi:hypothetical protein
VNYIAYTFLATDVVDAIESDYLLLYKAESSLPIEGIGHGVFAKSTIPANSIICEIRGPIISVDSYGQIIGNDKATSVRSIDDQGVIHNEQSAL